MFGINFSPPALAIVAPAPAISSIPPEIKRKLVEQLLRLQSRGPQEAAAGPTPVVPRGNLGGAVEMRPS